MQKRRTSAGSEVRIVVKESSSSHDNKEALYRRLIVRGSNHDISPGIRVAHDRNNPSS
jgi:hypothetical protein